MNTKLVLPPPKFDSFSDFGGVGLLQMPSARFAPEGTFGLNVSYVAPYLRTSVTIQPLSWLEGTVRYSDIGNRSYGPESFSGNQTYKDKGIDLKIRLLEESKNSPQIALGMRDIGGTGLFSAEFLTINRRYYDFDLLIGFGWGYLGNRGHVKNPLAFISDRFKIRPAPSSDVANAGKLGFVTPFSGERISIFGGLTYQTPIPNLVFKLEYDGNNYLNEPLSNTQSVRSPINVGLTYSYNNWLDVSVGYERGNQFLFQIALHSNIHRSKGMPKFDPEPERIKPRDLSAEIANYQKTNQSKQTSDALIAMRQALNALNYKVESLHIDDKEITATLGQSSFRNRAKAIGRAARVMANVAPPHVEMLSIVDLQGSLETQKVTLSRKDLENAVTYQSSIEEMANSLLVQPPINPAANSVRANFAPENSLYPYLTWGWTPAMRHHIGGPDDPYFYQVYLRAFSDWQVTRNFSLSGELGLNVFNNFSDLKLPSDSVLPHVRSDIKDYLKEGANGITLLQADYITNLGPNRYGRISAGLFEDMFGGIGAEFLYKPFGKRWAIGADLNWVKQREYDKRFSFRDYQVKTGHLDFYYQLPFYNMTAQLSLGQYLAGDRGATVALSKKFDSGAEFGVFATKTNVSAEDFGEGSFDKGLYVTIPFDFLSLYSSRSSIGVGWRPLTRDGGQRLIQNKRLYPMVAGSGRDSLMSEWSDVLK